MQHRLGDYAYKEWEEMVYKGTEYPEMSIDEVGIFAPSDTELVLVLEKPLKGFYLKYSLTDSWLVRKICIRAASLRAMVFTTIPTVLLQRQLLPLDLTS